MTNLDPAAIATSTLNGAMSGAAQAFVGLAPSIPPIFTLVQAFCWSLGVAMIIHAIFKLKQIKNKQNPAEISPIIIEFIAAVALINLNLVIATGVESIFAGEYKISPLAYTVQANGEMAMRAHNVLTAVLSFIQLVGYISCARAISILNGVSKNKPDCSLGKGLTHFLGGVMAANIGVTFTMLSATFLPNGGSL